MSISVPCYGIIPARYASSRLPGKPLVDIGGHPMFWHVYERARQCDSLKRVIVATDDTRILEAAKRWEVPCVMTRADHASGTDRTFEAARLLGVEEDAVIVNIQGDEPLLDPAMINQLVAPFEDDSTAVSTLAMPIIPERATDPNQVKVVTAVNGNALYFSRAPIPFDRDDSMPDAFFGHIGMYAFRMTALARFVSLPQSPLEKKEKLEQLRFLENGISIRVVMTEYRSRGVDTPEDLEAVRAILAAQ